MTCTTVPSTPTEAPSVARTLTAVRRVISKQASFADAIDAFASLLEADTWLSCALASLATESRDVGHVKFAQQPWLVQELFVGSIHHLAVEVYYARRQRADYPELFDQDWVDQAAAAAPLEFHRSADHLIRHIPRRVLARWPGVGPTVAKTARLGRQGRK